jgi:hypothetical protein
MYKSIFSLFFFSFFALAAANGQTAVDTKEEVTEKKADKKPNVWKTLSKITYKKEYNEIMGFKVDVPVFSQEIKDLGGQVVELKGYIIPVEGYKSHKEFIFSAFPYNMCFFCGGAGPETVMEVEAIDPVKFTSGAIKLRGILQLNADDINNLMFKIVDAQQIEKD